MGSSAPFSPGGRGLPLTPTCELSQRGGGGEPGVQQPEQVGAMRRQCWRFWESSSGFWKISPRSLGNKFLRGF